MALPKELELIDLDKPPKAVRKSPRRKSKKKTSGKKLILEGDGKDGLPEMSLWEVYNSEESRDMTKEHLKNIRGFLLKKKKWPLKGFHKRYFVLEEGMLTYGRSLSHIQKGKIHGRLDMGVPIISVNSVMKHIDIDGGEQSVYHLKATSHGQYEAWLSLLRQHRLYRQSQLTNTELDPAIITSLTSSIGNQEDEQPDWILQGAESLSNFNSELSKIQQNLDALQMAALDNGNSTVPAALAENNTLENSISGVGTLVDTPKKKKFGKVKKKGYSQIDLRQPSHGHSESDQLQVLSNPDLNHSHSMNNIADRSSLDSNTLRSSFVTMATSIHQDLQELLKKMKLDQDKLKQALEKENQLRLRYQGMVANLQANLYKVTAQNTEYKDRLAKIQMLSNTGGLLSRTPGWATSSFDMSTPLSTQLPNSRSFRSGSVQSSLKAVQRVDSFLSVAGSTWSGTEFYDAQEELVLSNLASSDENTEEEDDETDDESEFEEATPNGPMSPLVTGMAYRMGSGSNTRRTQLPCPRMEKPPSLLSIFRKHIGKDLSKVSMPVTMNEPLSALQRLCEELQYCNLIHRADKMEDPFDRMVQVAAFAVSSYAGTEHRASSKPFNPILGETYEYVREDLGFKFISEQVSHHPPIAACHAEGEDFEFWQDAQIKSKYWGRSFEVFPIGTVNLKLKSHGDHYKWNKVTSCIYNIMGGQRSVDHYGYMTITNGSKCYCKLTFSKTTSWSTKKHYVRGTVYNMEDQEVRHLYGHWQTGLYIGDDGTEKNIWTAKPIPLQTDDYYGFSQFAIELNEMETWNPSTLPSTDCRFRPDQRLLENGCVLEAQSEKERVEQLQREARKERENRGEKWQPNYFQKELVDGEECWVFKGNYWSLKESEFKSVNMPVLW